MQEEVTQKTIAITFKSARLTTDVLLRAFKAYLEHRRHREPSHGKISVKKLLAQNQGAKSIEITDENIKSFSRIAVKYNVDFSVKRDRTADPPKYLVFFKAKDSDLIVQAFKEFVRANEKKKQRVSALDSGQGKGSGAGHRTEKTVFERCALSDLRVCVG